jgi:O-methyltransferase involved in polyketide biosynthesis
MSNSERISPTAHYTGHVWARNGLSHPALQTLEGRLLYESLRSTLLVTSALWGLSLEAYLLARHRSIDQLLERAIEAGEVTQVVEVACGLSPRGWRFASRYGSTIDYLEADLPGMATRKRAALERIGSLGRHHRVLEIDALTDSGPRSLAAIADAELDPDRGTAIITEGLTGYLDGPGLIGMWERFAGTLERFPTGLYLSDLHIGAVQDARIRAFRLALSAFVRGHVHLHFEGAEQAQRALRKAGFAAVTLTPAAEIPGSEEGGLSRSSRLVHIIEASSASSQ